MESGVKNCVEFGHPYLIIAVFSHAVKVLFSPFLPYSRPTIEKLERGFKEVKKLIPVRNADTSNEKEDILEPSHADYNLRTSNKKVKRLKRKNRYQEKDEL